MRKLILGAIIVFLTIYGMGPAYGSEEEYAKEVKERKVTLPKCDKPLGVVAVRSFRCKAKECYGEVGSGLADMLITALVNSGCFKVVERMTLSEIKEELELSGTSPQSSLKAADFLITGAVTAMEMKAGGTGGGGIVIPLPLGIGGGLKIGKGDAHVALDMRIIKVKDGEVISARTVEGKASRWRLGIAGGAFISDITTAVGGWFEKYKNTPMEEAIRDLLANALIAVVEDVKAKEMGNSK